MEAEKSELWNGKDLKVTEFAERKGRRKRN